MSIERTIQKGLSDFSFILGRGLMYGGGAGLLVMAVVGTISVDLVILSAAERRRDSFLTGFVLGSMFSRGNVDPVPLLIASPITSAIAVALSFALGVPGVGVAILVGWGVAASLVAIGYGLEQLSKAIAPELEPDEEIDCCFSPSPSPW